VLENGGQLTEVTEVASLHLCTANGLIGVVS